MPNPLKKLKSIFIRQENDASNGAPVILQDVSLAGGRETQITVTPEQITLTDADTGKRQVILINGEAENLTRIQEEVRCQIARKIAMLVPALDEARQEQLQVYTFKVLHFMAKDEASRVRRMISQELGATPNAPRDLVRDLAWDEDMHVAGPILEFSPLLTDDELMDIISHSKVPGVAEAIAKRKGLSEPVSQKIVEGEDAEAITKLLNNESAQISEETMLQVLERAPEHEAWHSPLLHRPELTMKTVNTIARFISFKVLGELEQSGKIAPQVKRTLALAVSSRLKSAQIDRQRIAEMRVSDLASYGLLTPEVLIEELESGEHEFVLAALAVMSQLPKEVVQRMLNTQNPRAVTALAWRAGLGMRDAIQLQLRVAKIHHTLILNAKDGTDYPLPPEVLEEYIAHFAGE